MKKCVYSQTQGFEIDPMQWLEVDKAHIFEGIAIMFLFLQSTRVDWLDAETSRQRRNFALTLQLVMWIRTISFAVGVHRLTFPFTRAISRTDTFMDKKLIESCCTVFQLKVFQKKELQAERFWHSRVPIYGARDAGRGL